MYYIKLEEDKSLVTTVYEPIYRGDHLDQKITYLVPLAVNDVNMLKATVYLNYLRADGEPDVVLLERKEDLYKEAFYQYQIPVSCKISRYAGEVITWMTIFNGDADNPQIMKSGENVIRVLESKNMDDYMSDWRCDRQLTALYQIKKLMDNQVERIDESISEINSDMTAISDDVERLWAEKGDGLIYNADEKSMQLTAGGEPIGDKAYISTLDGKLIDDVKLTTDGELIIFYTDGSFENLGSVKGADGKVYVPHMDDRKIITWTLEAESGNVPDPVDLNPNDEWSSISDDADGRTDYTWDRI